MSHTHTQPSLNEVPAPTPAPTSSQTPPPSNEGGERKRSAPAGGDENVDPEDKPPKAKQPRTIEIELPPSNTSQDTTGMSCVSVSVHVCVCVCVCVCECECVCVCAYV